MNEREKDLKNLKDLKSGGGAYQSKTRAVGAYNNYNNRHAGTWAALGLIAVLILLTLGYFAVQVAQYYADPFSTALVYSYSIEESLELSGWVIRNEQVMPEQSGEYLRILRKEGERVSAGGVVAEAYPSQEALELRVELDNLSDKLEQLKYARDAMKNGDASVRMDGQIFQTLLDYHADLAADRMIQAEQTGAQLRSMILRRNYANIDLSQIELEIAAAESEIAELNLKTSGAVWEIQAPASGLWSAVLDGYEARLTPEEIQNLTPSRLNQIDADLKSDSESNENAQSGFGKLVLGNAWYYAAPVSVSNLQELRRRDGSWILRFSKGGERDFPVKLDSVSAEENGYVTAVFKSENYLAETTVLRRQKARLIFGTVSGLRVPREALRILNNNNNTPSPTPTPTMTDSEETDNIDYNLDNLDNIVENIAPDNNINNNITPTPTPSRTIGVYCVVGTEARFKPVNALYTGDQFLLVAPSTPVREELRLRQGDEVIVRGENLYDRKVLTGNN